MSPKQYDINVPVSDQFSGQKMKIIGNAISSMISLKMCRTIIEQIAQRWILRFIKFLWLLSFLILASFNVLKKFTCFKKMQRTITFKMNNPDLILKRQISTTSRYEYYFNYLLTYCLAIIRQRTIISPTTKTVKIILQVLADF